MDKTIINKVFIVLTILGSFLVSNGNAIGFRRTISPIDDINWEGNHSFNKNVTVNGDIIVKSTGTSGITMGGVTLSTADAGHLLINGQIVSTTTSFGSGTGNGNMLNPSTCTFYNAFDIGTTAYITPQLFISTIVFQDVVTQVFWNLRVDNGDLVMSSVTTGTGGSGTPGDLGSCISWWKFDEHTGSTAYDSVGSLDLTLDAQCTWYQGQDGIYIPAGYQAMKATGFTATNWTFYFCALLKGNGAYPCIDTNLGSDRQFETLTGVGFDTTFSWGSGTPGAKTIPAGWHKFVIVRYSDRTDWFVDGVFYNVNYSVYPTFSNGAVEFGRPGAVFGFGGAYVEDMGLKESALFDVGLTTAQINSNGMGN